MSRMSLFSGRPAWHFVLDAGVLFLLLGLAVLGFAPTFGADPYYLVAGLGGVLLGLAIAAAGAHWRWGLLVMTAVVLLGYLLFGNALAAPGESLFGFIPTGGSLRGLLLGVVFGWKQLLTIAAPVGTSVDVLVVPFLSALLCSVLAGTLAWRVRRAYWTMLPVLALFIASIVFGTDEPFLPTLRGILLGIAAICWLAYRRELLSRGMVHSGRAGAIDRPEGAAPALAAAAANRSRRLLAGAVVVVLAGGLTAAAMPMFRAGEDRKVLRDVVIPPLDPHNLPSPLTDFRRYVGDEAEQTLFSVSGLPRDARVRLAALDSYDGIVFNVDSASSGAFAPIGDPKSANRASEGDTSTLGFQIEDYAGAYIPGASAIRSLQYQAADGGQGLLYLNQDSNTAVKLDGVRKNDAYRVNVAFPPKRDEKQLEAAGFADLSMPKLANVPQAVGAKAVQIAGDKTSDYAKVKALADYFRLAGKYSNGIKGQVASLPGHSAARIAKFLSGKEIVGDDEQYAVTMALMARYLGIPARVVMGFYPDPKGELNGAPNVQIKGSDVHAWVEADFSGIGWVPFDPTPDKDHVPNPPDPQNASSPKPQVLQPPPPPQEQAELPPDSSPDALDNDKKKQDFWAVLGHILTVLGLAAIPVAVIVLPLLAIVLVKRRRRKKRFSEGAPAQRVGGGWSELLALATDLGAAVNPKQTRRETAGTLAGAFPASGGSTTALAERADSAIFGVGEPSEAEVAAFWSEVDGSLEKMNESVGFWHRMRARFSPRSLLGDLSLAMAQRPGSAGYFRKKPQSQPVEPPVFGQGSPAQTGHPASERGNE
ncbi:DUF3488 and transglutaminase-like domain-containing protein [Arthrobacter russicus]|uniref:Transglutaminase-like domain-containing protein n=1 Tax=Arthrobacter russicus TaxID=172040 RepID=A0ABU1JAS2_9MICC|nr:transglutaminaseTgpA domain-containing protein [Arthrobacter russicus]MDR6268981.1 hypothetical protein [Arthrobacter russicus]